MISTYRIGVNILAMNGVSPVLKFIMRDLMGFQNQVDAAGKKFGAWRGYALAVGAAVAGIGEAALQAEFRLAKMGDKLLQQRQLLVGTGVSGRSADALIQAAITSAIATPAVSAAEQAKIAVKLRAALGGPEEAAIALPGVARQVANLKFIGQGDAINDLQSMFKALEIMGASVKGGKLDPAAFAEAFRFMVHITAATSGLLTPGTMLRIAQTGGVAAQLGTFEHFIMDLGPLFEQMGPRAGTGISNLLQQFVGGKTTGATIAMMERYGLLQRGGFSRVIGGGSGSFFIKPGALYGYKDIQDPAKGFAYWLIHDLPAALHRAGVPNTREAMIPALARVVGSQRGARVLFDALTPAGEVTMAKERQVFAETVKAPLYSAEMKTLTANITSFRGALDSLFTVLGLPIIPQVVGYLKSLTEVLGSMTAWAQKNPAMVAQLGKVFSGIAAGMVVLGSVAVIGALVSLAGPGGLILALAAAIIALAHAFKLLPTSVLVALAGAAGGAYLGSAAGPPGMAIGAAAGLLGAGAITNPGAVVNRSFVGGAHSLGIHTLLTNPFAPGVLHPSTLPSPPSPQSTSTNGDPSPVWVVNGRDIADGVTKHQARGLQANPSGPTGHNPARGFLPPGLSILPTGP